LPTVTISATEVAWRDVITSRYLGIDVDTKLPWDWGQWKYKVIVVPENVGKEVLRVNWDVSEGSHTLYINVTDYAYGGAWNEKHDVKVRITTVTGQVLVDTMVTISRPGAEPAAIQFTVPSGTPTSTSPGGISGTGTQSTTSTTFNWEDAVNKMMKTMLPAMMNIMTIGMMIQAMAGIMSSMAGAFAG